MKVYILKHQTLYVTLSLFKHCVFLETMSVKYLIELPV